MIKLHDCQQEDILSVEQKFSAKTFFERFRLLDLKYTTLIKRVFDDSDETELRFTPLLQFFSTF